jgi:hypothetical protein
MRPIVRSKALSRSPPDLGFSSQCDQDSSKLTSRVKLFYRLLLALAPELFQSGRVRLLPAFVPSGPVFGTSIHSRLRHTSEKIC